MGEIKSELLWLSNGKATETTTALGIRGQEQPGNDSNAEQLRPAVADDILTDAVDTPSDTDCRQVMHTSKLLVFTSRSRYLTSAYCWGATRVLDELCGELWRAVETRVCAVYPLQLVSSIITQTLKGSRKLV